MQFIHINYIWKMGTEKKRKKKPRETDCSHHRRMNLLEFMHLSIGCCYRVPSFLFFTFFSTLRIFQLISIRHVPVALCPVSQHRFDRFLAAQHTTQMHLIKSILIFHEQQQRRSPAAFNMFRPSHYRFINFIICLAERNRN